MVFYFTSIADPSYTFYVGKNKDENEVLLAYMWPEDVWFHVADYSSPHVYLRLHPGQDIDDIPLEVVQECAQLCKAGSIKGNKLDNITVIYTPYPNLRKEASMEAGEVGFHDEKAVKRIKVSTRNGPLLRKLEKTKRELFPDLRREREERDAEEKRKADHEKDVSKKREADEKKALKQKAMAEQAQKEYREVFANDELKTTNKELAKTSAKKYEEEEFW